MCSDVLTLTVTMRVHLGLGSGPIRFALVTCEAGGRRWRLFVLGVMGRTLIEKSFWERRI